MKRLRVGKSQVQRKFKYFSGSWAWDVPVPTIAITIGNRFISGLRIMHHFLTLMNIKFVHISAFLISAYLNMYALLIYAIFILGSLTWSAWPLMNHGFSLNLSPKSQRTIKDQKLFTCIHFDIKLWFSSRSQNLSSWFEWYNDTKMPDELHVFT